MKLEFSKDENTMQGYSDADWASNIDKKKSVIGHVFNFKEVVSRRVETNNSL